MFRIRSCTSLPGCRNHPAPRPANRGARHGKRTPDGLNAFTNFAFFDGHAESEPSVNYDHDGEGATDLCPWTGRTGLRVRRLRSGHEWFPEFAEALNIPRRSECFHRNESLPSHLPP